MIYHISVCAKSAACDNNGFCFDCVFAAFIRNTNTASFSALRKNINHFIVEPYICILTHCRFIGGCPGNTQGVARLAEGRPAAEVVRLLKGIQCRNGTSCPDQLARALEQTAK